MLSAQCIYICSLCHVNNFLKGHVDFTIWEYVAQNNYYIVLFYLNFAIVCIFDFLFLQCQFRRVLSVIMGAYKYIQELYRKKQSDVMRFLLRIRCWQYRQLTTMHRAPRPSRPDKARRMGYKAKQGMKVVFVCILNQSEQMENTSDELYMHHSYIFSGDYVFLRLQNFRCRCTRENMESRL